MVFHPESVYRSPEAMDAYFGGQTPPGSLRWPGSWSWHEEPFRFRLAFHGVVDGVAYLVGVPLGQSLTTYWMAYVITTLVSVMFAGCATVVFLRAAGCTMRQTLFGFGLWLTLPPIHHAFVLPTQTKEDFVAYGMVAFGLAAIIQQRNGLVVIISVLGALTRETLLVVPMIFALTARVGPLVRFMPLAAAGATLGAVRLAMSAQGYEAMAHFSLNLSRPGILITALAFIFGAAWLFMLPSLKPSSLAEASRCQLKALFGQDEGAPALMVERVEKTTVLTVVTLLAVHLLFGRIQETRITALAAPLLILYAARRFDDTLATSAKRWVLVALTVLGVLVLGLELMGIASALRTQVNPEIGSFGSRYWWAELYVQLAIAVAIVTWVLASRANRPPRRLRTPGSRRLLASTSEP